MLSPKQKLPRRLMALLLTLVLFAPASSFGRILYSCGMSGRVTAGACCCHRAKAQAQRAEQAAGAQSAARVESASCCKVDDNRRVAVPAALLLAEATVLAAGEVGLEPAFEPRALTSEQVSWCARSIRGPPPLGVYVTNCSLLI
jgi:hypothetical protein